MTTDQKRIQIIDALRGFALAGIVIAHFTENYIGGPPPAAFNEAVHPGIIDSVIEGLNGFFIRGKFFALFSFLFGLSFFLQMDRAAVRGENYGLRFLWRIVILFGIGYLHHLFYRGDILTIYAIVGIFLIPFYKVPVRWSLVLCILIFLGVCRISLFYITGGNPVFTEVNLDPGSENVAAYYETLSTGTLWEVFKTNSIDGLLQKMEFQFGVFSRGYLTFGFFLLGLISGKIGLFIRYDAYLKRIKYALLAAALLFLLAGGGTAFFMSAFQNGFDFQSLRFMFGLNFFDLVNIAMTVIFICLFILMWRKKWGFRLLSSFTDYGKMALTNYLFQTLVGTFILYGWGLGYIGKIRIALISLIALVFIAVQMYLSKLWLKRFNYGPFEWIWRCLTHFKIFPIVKKNTEV
ncbi:DUF418 domain-containing protein [Flavobacteriaceae bacterium M23B6Z8]